MKFLSKRVTYFSLIESVCEFHYFLDFSFQFYLPRRVRRHPLQLRHLRAGEGRLLMQVKGAGDRGEGQGAAADVLHSVAKRPEEGVRRGAARRAEDEKPVGRAGNLKKSLEHGGDQQTDFALLVAIY